MDTVICEECNGSGLQEEKNGTQKICNNCFGYGRLTWLENLFGADTGKPPNVKLVQEIEVQNKFLEVQLFIHKAFYGGDPISALNRIEGSLTQLKKDTKILDYHVEMSEQWECGDKIIRIDLSPATTKASRFGFQFVIKKEFWDERLQIARL